MEKRIDAKASKQQSLGEFKEPRRNFLKRLRNWVGMGAGAVVLGREVYKTVEKKVVTDEAEFYPIYEHHDFGIKQEQIPKGIDMYVIEMLDPVFGRYISDKLDDVFKYANPKDNSSYLQEQGLKLGFTDIEIGHRLNIFTKKDWSDMVGMIALWGSVAVIGETNEAKITRRNFLKLVGGVGAVLSIEQITGLIALGIGRLDQDQSSAAVRIAHRIHGLSSHFDVDDAVIFFRNVVNASKMLELGKWYQSGYGIKPKIAYGFGGGHTGMEDFLVLGQEFCQKIISSMPKHWLKQVAEWNGGVYDVSSSRVFDFSVNSHEQNYDTRVVDKGLYTVWRNKLVD